MWQSYIKLVIKDIQQNVKACLHPEDTLFVLSNSEIQTTMKRNYFVFCKSKTFFADRCVKIDFIGR